MKGRIAAYQRFLTSLRRFLDTPLSYDQARAAIARRLEQREQEFLRVVRGCVYDNPISPYTALLEQARCDYGDLVSGVRRWGLEGLLHRLREAGVWISFDEFKARQPLHRSTVELPLSGASFDNHWRSATCEVRSGGTSGPATRTQFDLDFLTDRACYSSLLFRMLDIHEAPLALWYPKLPAVTGVGHSLLSAKIGRPPDRWFCLTTDRRVRPGWDSRLATAAIVWLSRLTPQPLAWPEAVGVERVEKPLDWMLETLVRHGRCVLQSYVSQAVRLSHAAAARGVTLEGAQFVVNSEPLTPAKLREVESVGAKICPRYDATEVGTIGIGCGQPSEAGDYHLLSDSLAVIQTASEGIAQPSPLYFTSLLSTAPKILLNVQLGDSSLMEQASCSCLLGEVGLRTHLRRVRNFGRTTSEGMKLRTAELTRIMEEVLPGKFGGSSLDYQWIEREGDDSLTRLWLRIAPRIGAINEVAVVREVLTELRRGDAGQRLTAELWRQADTLRILRESPQPTARGKLLPVLRESLPTTDAAAGHQ